MLTDPKSIDNTFSELDCKVNVLQIAVQDSDTLDKLNELSINVYRCSGEGREIFPR